MWSSMHRLSSPSRTAGLSNRGLNGFLVVVAAHKTSPKRLAEALYVMTLPSSLAWSSTRMIIWPRTMITHTATMPNLPMDITKGGVLSDDTGKDNRYWQSQVGYGLYTGQDNF